MSTLSQVLGDLVDQGQLRFNVARLVKLPKLPEHRDRGWNPDATRRFLAHVADHRLYPLFLVSLCGLRRGELLRLTWSDVDLDAATVTVRESKTAAGRRTIPLPPSVTAALRTFRKRLAEERLAAGQAYTPSDTVAVDEIGVPIPGKRYGNTFQRLAGQAGVPVTTLHGARHSCVTAMRDQGVAVETVAMFVGHARQSWGSFSIERYRNDPDEPALRRAAAALEAAYFPASSAAEQSSVTHM